MHSPENCGSRHTGEPMNHNETLHNRATLAASEAGATCADCGGDELVFALRDAQHTFSMDLSTILKCLALAQEECAVPVLPDAWWLDVGRRYKVASPTR